MPRFYSLISSCLVVALGVPLLADQPIEPTPASPALLKIQDSAADEVVPTPAKAGKKELSQAEQLKQWREKKAQLEALRREVAELERDLAIGTPYQVRCIMGEVDLRTLAKAAPEIETPDEMISVLSLFTGPQKSQAMPTAMFQAVRHCLEETKSVKVLMEPDVVTPAGQTATVHSGGEFPVVLAANQSKGPEWREFGTTFETSVEPLGDGRLRVHVAPEFNERDFANAVKARGVTIPGINSRGMNFSADIQPGETIFASGFVSQVGKNPKALFVAVTVTPVTAPQRAATAPMLSPVPEPATR